MFCTSCGQKLESRAKFCAKCGNSASKQNLTSEMTAVTQSDNVDNLSLWGYFIKCFKKYATFSGRARRKEYWGFFLFISIFSIIGSAISMMPMVAIISWIFTLATFIPSLAVGVRRLHDIGRSGWNLLWGLIPIIGFIIILIWHCTDGDAAGNKYGPNPKVNYF
jgi:uncharacterized membrane protein YhaH (DUF805 family)